MAHSVHDNKQLSLSSTHRYLFLYLFVCLSISALVSPLLVTAQSTPSCSVQLQVLKNGTNINEKLKNSITSTPCIFTDQVTPPNSILSFGSDISQLEADLTTIAIRVQPKIGVYRISVVLSKGAAQVSLLPQTNLRPEVFYLELLANKAVRSGKTIMNAAYDIELSIHSPPTTLPNSQLISWVTTRFQSVINAKMVDAFIVAANDDLMATVSSMAEQARIPIIGTNSPNPLLYDCTTVSKIGGANVNCASASNRRFQYMHGIFTTAPGYMPLIMNAYKLKKAQTMAFFYSPEVAFYNQACMGGLNTGVDLGMIPVMYKPVPSPTYPVYDNVTLTTTVEQLKRLDPDVVIMCVQSCGQWVKAFKDANYAPRGWASTNCVDFPIATTLGDDARYIVGPSQWSPLCKGNEYTETVGQPGAYFPTIRTSSTSITVDSSVVADIERAAYPGSQTPNLRDVGAGNTTTGIIGPTGQYVGTEQSAMQFAQLWARRWNTTLADYKIATSFVSWVVLEKGIYYANSTNPVVVNSNLQDLYDWSFFGVTSENRVGWNQQKSMAIVQRDGNATLQLVQPLFSATIDLIYPMPTWKERIFDDAMYSRKVEVAITTIMAVCAGYLAFILLTLLYYRQTRVVKAMSVTFSMVTILSAIMGVLSILTWPVQNNLETCHSRIWVWTLSYHLFVNSIIAKTNRISGIFNAKKLSSVARAASPVAVTLTVVLLTLPQLIINFVWLGYQLEPELIVPDKLRPAQNFVSCNSSSANADTALAAVTLGYGGLLIIIACYLSFRIRHVTSVFNESKNIAASVYLFTITAILVVILQFSMGGDNDRVDSIYAIRSVLVIIAYTISVSVLFVPALLTALQSKSLPASENGKTAISGSSNSNKETNTTTPRRTSTLTTTASRKAASAKPRNSTDLGVPASASSAARASNASSGSGSNGPVHSNGTDVSLEAVKVHVPENSGVSSVPPAADAQSKADTQPISTTVETNSVVVDINAPASAPRSNAFALSPTRTSHALLPTSITTHERTSSDSASASNSNSVPLDLIVPSPSPSQTLSTPTPTRRWPNTIRIHLTDDE